MKAVLFDAKGEKKSEIQLPEIFASPVREDIVAKVFESEKEMQPYSPYKEAGKRHSASGRQRHIRHKWRTAYGRGISRVPKKTMWRRGTQFYWIGAEVSSARGGRRAHPPKGFVIPKKINRKERVLALNSALAATADKDYVAKRYATISEIKSTPFVIEALPAKTKEIFAALKKIYGELFNLALKRKSVRAGRGKTRGRKYKSTAGLLLIVGKDEDAKISGIDVKKSNRLKVKDLYPLGRLTLFTKKALEELGAKK